MDVNDRLTRLEDALADLTLIVAEGHVDRFHAHIVPEVASAGGRIAEFYGAVQASAR